MGRRQRGGRFWWAELTDAELLDVRLCDLGLTIADSPLEARLGQLGAELERAGLRFRPYAWLSTDWFTPEGCTGFAIPFFLAHPRLVRLERRQMFEVEGGRPGQCMKLVRHEAAHALDSAFGLHRRRRWRAVFGPYSSPYRRSYVPRIHSRNYVMNLDHWYAQSHPAEDFAETFAVWLAPRSAWRRRYGDWPALAKLEYVDELMGSIRNRRPGRRTRERVDPLARLRLSLREYYARKHRIYGEPDLSVYDRDLRRLFSADPAHSRRPTAAAFLRRHRVELRNRVAQWSQQQRFVVDRALDHLVWRSHELRLRLARNPRETLVDATVVLTVHTIRLMRRPHREFMR